MVLLQCIPIKRPGIAICVKAMAMSDVQLSSDEIDPITPELARANIMQSITATLGDNWDDEDTGWVVIHDSDYYIRLTRNNILMDFQCDLLGEVNIHEQEAIVEQNIGRLLAWMVLGASLALAYLLALLAGVME